jgi:hypothetical protein
MMIAAAAGASFSKIIYCSRYFLQTDAVTAVQPFLLGTSPIDDMKNH